MRNIEGRRKKKWRREDGRWEHVRDGWRRQERVGAKKVWRVYLESVGHGLSEPDVLLLLDVLADVPVLLGNLALSGRYAGLSSLHVTVNLDGILNAALVGVNPVLA